MWPKWLDLGVALHVSQGPQDYPDLPKKICVCRHTHTKPTYFDHPNYVDTHTKPTYFDHPNKNIDHSNLRITRILI